MLSPNLQTTHKKGKTGSNVFVFTTMFSMLGSLNMVPNADFSFLTKAKVYFYTWLDWNSSQQWKEENSMSNRQCFHHELDAYNRQKKPGKILQAK